jgi:hypothetical protein
LMFIAATPPRVRRLSWSAQQERKSPAGMTPAGLFAVSGLWIKRTASTRTACAAWDCGCSGFRRRGCRWR